MQTLAAKGSGRLSRGVRKVWNRLRHAEGEGRHLGDGVKKEQTVTGKQRIGVLLVDDEERFRTTATTTLQTRGFSVRAVGSGMEALDELRKGGVDVVVLDVKMPGMDGHETLRRMKILKPDLEVIMLTGYGTLESSLEAWGESVFAYLTKPCDIDILAEKIGDAVEKKRGVDGVVSYLMWSRRRSEEWGG